MRGIRYPGFESLTMGGFYDNYFTSQKGKMGQKKDNFVRRSGERILKFLDKDNVKLVVLVLVSFWLYGIIRYRIYLLTFRKYESSISRAWALNWVINILPFAIFFFICGMVIAIALTNKLFLKSVIAGCLVTALIIINFPHFLTLIIKIDELFSLHYLYPCLCILFGTLFILILKSSKEIRRILKSGLTITIWILFVWLFSKNAITFSKIYFNKKAPETFCESSVKNFSSLITNLKFTEEFTKKDLIQNRKEFDINNYFKILSHLRMEPGYKLNFVYSPYTDGFPILYSQNTDEPPFMDYEEFKNARGEMFWNEYWARVTGESGTEHNESLYGYMDHILIDDTPEGYFQFILLRLMGSQFYLFGHAKYNDQRIVCKFRQLRPSMFKQWPALYQAHVILDPWIIVSNKAAELSFEPAIKFEEETVKIRVIVFSEWAGYIQKFFLVSRNFPHKVLMDEKRTLIPYHCGLKY